MRGSNKQSEERRLTSLTISRTEAKNLLTKQLEQGLRFLQNIESYSMSFSQDKHVSQVDLMEWKSYTSELLRRIFDTDDLMKEFAKPPGKPIMLSGALLSAEFAMLGAQFLYYSQRLQTIIGRIDLFEEPQVGIKNVQNIPLEQIHLIARRFQVVSRQLNHRHQSRATLSISDEYDVQDLLHALLRLFFDDVRAEEWTPSYAGGSARLDFLLKAEQIVVEVKKTRRGMSDRDVGNQLLEDIGRYRVHPDCHSLVCFVYDPDGYITNPQALERDLTRDIDGFPVTVIISPKGL